MSDKQEKRRSSQSTTTTIGAFNTNLRARISNVPAKFKGNSLMFVSYRHSTSGQTEVVKTIQDLMLIKNIFTLSGL